MPAFALLMALTGARSAVALAAAPSLSACAEVAAPAADPAHLRLVFVGDSGFVPEDGGCRYRADGSAEADCHIRVDELARLKSAIRAVEADAIYGLGDLVYPMAPACRKATGAPLRALAVTIGAFYADLGAPVWLVLGNHDLGHLDLDCDEIS